MGAIKQEQINVGLYRQLIMQRLDELSLEFNKNKDSGNGVLINMERCGLIYALNLLNDERVNRIEYR